MIKKFFIGLYLVILLLTINIVLPLPQVSYELQSGLIAADPAPYAPTAEKRLWLWLQKYTPVIRTAAKKYNVNPVDMAGIIAWEGFINDHIRRMTYTIMLNYTFNNGLFLKSIGPGKVQAWGNNNAATFLEGNPRYHPVFPRLPASYFPPLIERIIRLHDPAISIDYIAGIMNAYATEAEKAGYTDIRTQPGVLPTFFDGVRDYSLPHSAEAFNKRMKTQGKIPFKLNNMGQWIKDHQPYLTSAITPHSDEKQ